MSFSVGKVFFDIVGNDQYLSYFRNMFSRIENDQSPDLIFEFVRRLPPLPDFPTVTLDNFVVAKKSITHHETLFTYRIDWSSLPIKVFVCPRKFDCFRQAQIKVKKGWQYFHTHGSNVFLHYFKRFVFYIYMPAVQLYLLKQGASFAHCSAIQKNGKSVLFPAWGGIGKTGLMSLFLSQGWKFLSDDLGILDKDGIFYLHPLPMHIYKYHQIQSPELVTNMLTQLSPTDRATWKLLAPFKKANKLVRWVKPESVFGNDTICKEGAIIMAVHMHRHSGKNEFIFEESCCSGVAALMASTLLKEINNLADYAIVYHSVRESNFIPNISQMYETIAAVYTQAMRNAKCCKLSIPDAATTADAFRFLKEKRIIPLPALDHKT